MEQVELLVQIPASLSREIQKYLYEKSDGKSLQGMKKVIAVSSFYSYLLEHGKKISNQASKECMEIINNGRFQI